MIVSRESACESIMLLVLKIIKSIVRQCCKTNLHSFQQSTFIVLDVIEYLDLTRCVVIEIDL